MWLLIGIVWFIELATCVAQAQGKTPDSTAFSNYNVALKHASNNTCPYLIHGSKKLPVICWICHFPHGMSQSNRYTYDCCPGYERSTMVNNKCVQMEVTWKPIIQYLRDRGYVKAAQALNTNTGIEDLATSLANSVYTVFVPQEDNDLDDADPSYSGRDNAARMLVAAGRHYSYGFTNGRKIRNEHSTDLKITTYSNGLVFIECKMLLSVDHETTNGLVHYTDGPLPGTFQYPTVLSLLSAQPDLSQFVQSLPQDIKTVLGNRESAKWYTVFAPTNRAWSQAVQKLKSTESIATLARHHLLNKMLCSGAVLQKSNPIGPTAADDYLKLTATSDGNTAIIDACGVEIPLGRKDLMSGNGVVHVIDKTVTLLKTLGLSETLDCLTRDPQLGLSQASRAIKACGLDSKTRATVILLPDDSAFEWLRTNGENRASSQRILTNSDYRCKVYAHHLLTPADGRPLALEHPGGFAQEQKFQSDYIAPNGQHGVVFSHYVSERDGSKLSFNAAVTRTKTPIRYRDGLIYPVTQMNFPPEKTMLEIVQSEPDTREIARKLESTGGFRQFAALNGKVLFLAPIDMGWNTRDMENGYNKEETTRLLQLHTIPHALFGGENGHIAHSTQQTVDTLLSSRDGRKVELIIKRYPDGNTFIGHSELPENLWAMVLRWNRVGTDGVVWIIDWPIKCPVGTC